MACNFQRVYAESVDVRTCRSGRLVDVVDREICRNYRENGLRARRTGAMKSWGVMWHLQRGLQMDV